MDISKRREFKSRAIVMSGTSVCEWREFVFLNQQQMVNGQSWLQLWLIKTITFFTVVFNEYQLVWPFTLDIAFLLTYYGNRRGFIRIRSNECHTLLDLHQYFCIDSGEDGRQVALSFQLFLPLWMNLWLYWQNPNLKSRLMQLHSTLPPSLDELLQCFSWLTKPKPKI